MRGGWGRVKPPLGTPVNRGHPLADRLRWAWLAQGSHMAYSETPMAPGTPAGMAYVAASEVGRGSYHTASAGNRLVFGPGQSAYGDLSTFIVVRLFTIHTATLAVQMETLDQDAVWRWDYGYSTFTFHVSPAFLTTHSCESVQTITYGPALYTLGGSYTRGTQAVVINGRLDRTVSHTPVAYDARPISGGLVLGAPSATVGSSILGDLFLVYAWRRALSVGEFQSLHVNPYQFFVPPRSRIG